MAKREVVDGVKVERRKPEQMVDAHLAAAERAKKRAAMAKLTGVAGGRDIWNAHRYALLAFEHKGTLGGRTGETLAMALQSLEEVIAQLGGGALLAAPAGTITPVTPGEPLFNSRSEE